MSVCPVMLLIPYGLGSSLITKAWHPVLQLLQRNMGREQTVLFDHADKVAGSQMTEEQIYINLVASTPNSQFLPAKF